MMEPEVGNADVFLWALFDLGGDAEYIDVEDVYVRCHQFAPRRFSWRTKVLPDYKKCAKALRDAEARTPPLLVKTADGLKRQLSVEGQQWVRANAKWLAEVLAPGQPVPAPRRRPDSRALREIERHPVFVRWQGSEASPPPKWEVAELLRCSSDSSVKVWVQRIEVLRAAAFAAERKEILQFLDELRNNNPSWFGLGGNS